MNQLYITALDGEYKSKPTNHGEITNKFKTINEKLGEHDPVSIFSIISILESGVPHRTCSWKGISEGHSTVPDLHANMLCFDFDEGIITDDQRDKFEIEANKNFHIIQKSWSWGKYEKKYDKIKKREVEKKYRYHCYLLLDDVINDVGILKAIYEQVRKQCEEGFGFIVDSIPPYQTIYASNHKVKVNDLPLISVGKTESSTSNAPLAPDSKPLVNQEKFLDACRALGPIPERDTWIAFLNGLVGGEYEGEITTETMNEAEQLVSDGEKGSSIAERKIQPFCANLGKCMAIFKQYGISVAGIVRPKGKNDLTSRLIEAKIKKLEELQEQEDEDAAEEGRVPKKIKGLNPLQTAELILDHVQTLLIGEKIDEARFGVYLEDEGIYSLSHQHVYNLIQYVSPQFNERKCKDVVFFMSQRSEMKKQTRLKHLVPVNNGVFNKETMTLEPFTSDYIFLSKVKTNYNPHATNVTIDGWDVETWIKDLAVDNEVHTLLWQVLADSVQSNFSRRHSIWLVGDSGNNGKGTYQDLIKFLVGSESVARLKVEDFSKRFALYALVGATVVIGDDNNPQQYIDSSDNFKSSVTGDPLNVEGKHINMFSYEFRGANIQSMNGFPRVRDKSGGFTRRLIIVPFEKEFTGGGNWKIKDDYIQREEVLEYVLLKSLHLDFEQYIIPKRSQELVQEFKTDNDPVRAFCMDVVPELKSTKIPSTYLYAMFKVYMESEHPSAKLISSPEFSKALKKPMKELGWERSTNKFRLTPEHTKNESHIGLTGDHIHKELMDNKSLNGFCKVMEQGAF